MLETLYYDDFTPEQFDALDREIAEEITAGKRDASLDKHIEFCEFEGDTDKVDYKAAIARRALLNSQK